MRLCRCRSRKRAELRCPLCGGYVAIGRLAPPNHVALLAGSLAKSGEALVNDYRWAHEEGLGPARRGQIGRGSDTADPTGGTVADERKASLREHLRLAGRALALACYHVAVAREAVKDGLSAVDGGGEDHTPAPYHDVIPEGRPDLAESHAALERRLARGEGWGQA